MVYSVYYIVLDSRYSPRLPFMLGAGAAPLFTLGHEKTSAHSDDSYSQEAVDRVNELYLARFGWV